MSTIAQHIEFVNGQIAFHEKRAAGFKSPAQEWRRKIHLDTAAKFKELRADLESLQSGALSGAPKGSVSSSPLALTIEEIEGLPPEVLQELSISEGDRAEFAIIALIEEAGGIITLDKLIIGLYKRTGEVFKRQALTNRLYRMGQKGLIFNVPTKKGAYSTEELTPEQVDKLLSQRT